MNTVLALETTSEICSVALGYGRNILAESCIAPRRHNELILAMVDRLVDALESGRASLELVTFSCGPGSFTGVRLGAAIAQGIAQGLGISVIPVPTSDAFASRVRRLNPSLSNFAVQRKSHKGKAYVAQYRIVDDSCECVAPDRLMEIERIESLDHVVSDESLRVSAEDVLSVALQRLDSQVAPQSALPQLIEGDTPYKANA